MEVIFFPTKTEKGLELAHKIEEILAHKALKFYVANRFEEKIDQGQFLYACLAMDLIIFDATREADTNNYDFANELMKHLPHCIIVSRNYLPINLFSVVKGGYPDYVKKEMSNDEIADWLKTHIDDFLVERPEEEKKAENQVNVLQRGMKAFREKQMQETNVFISFRTKYEKRTNPGFPEAYHYDVRTLAKAIQEGEFHGKQKKSAKFLDNGALVFDNEILTEHQMWTLLSIIDDEFIINCDEFWIYGSKDYLDSWWTQGELVTFANTLQSGITIEPFNQDKRLRLYDPATNKVHDIPKEYYPQLNLNQIKRKSRLYTTASPNQMGPESNRMKSRIKKIAFLFRSPLTRWMIKPGLKKMFNQQMDMYKQLNVPIPEEEFTFESWYDTYFSKDYLEDTPFSEAFWNQKKILTPNSTEKDRLLRFEKLQKLNLSFSADEIDAFFDLKGFVAHPVNQADIDRGYIEIVENGVSVQYRIAAEPPRFHFSPSRFEQDFSTTKQNLEIVPTYRFFKPENL